MTESERGIARNDLSEAFYAEIIQLFRGLKGSGHTSEPDESENAGLKGREAALARSDELDRIWSRIEYVMPKYHDGLSDEAVSRRKERRSHILEKTWRSEEDWNNWQVKNIVTGPDQLESIVNLRHSELESVKKAVGARLPFGITPY